MRERLCLCSAMEAGEFDNKYRDSDHRPEAINWSKNSDGSYETGLLKDEEVNARVKCQCGKYMITYFKGGYRKRMVAVCSCDNPKPKIMEIKMNKLEQELDKELGDLGIRPYVYHIRAYGEGSQRKSLRLFNTITIADTKHMATVDVEYIVGELTEELRLKVVRTSYDAKPDTQPATWMMAELRGFGYYGVAICDRRDNFSRKRGRIIAKGRLLKYLRSRPAMMYGRAEMDQRVVAKGRLVVSSEGLELPDGTK